jgi:hypothetical protein
MFWSPAYAARWHFLPGVLALCIAMTYSRIRAMWQRTSARTPIWSQALSAGVYLGTLYGCWVGDYVVLTFFLIPVFTFFCALAVSTCVFEAASRTCVYIFDRRFEFESRETAA